MIDKNESLFMKFKEIMKMRYFDIDETMNKSMKSNCFVEIYCRTKTKRNSKLKYGRTVIVELIKKSISILLETHQLKLLNLGHSIEIVTFG